MTDPRHALGLAAEDAVAAWLGACGWTVVRRRARSNCGGEVDLVALDPSAVLVAIEVRARRSSRTGPAAASVDLRRIARLRRTLAAVASAEPDRAAGRWRLTRLPGVG
jgi:Holliday junction resolvase-like predicted endonuclease